jgi:hypothetical protein
MRAFVRFLGFLILVAGLVGGGAWFWAGRMDGPMIEIRQPGEFIGQATMLELMVSSPGGEFSSVQVTVEQEGRSFEVFDLAQPAQGSLKQDTAERIYVMRPVGKRAIGDLKEGQARIVVTASRPVLFGIRDAASTATRDVKVRLQPCSRRSTTSITGAANSASTGRRPTTCNRVYEWAASSTPVIPHAR